MEDKMTLEELRQHLAQIETRQKELATEYEDRDFPQAVEDEFEALKAERDKTREAISKREERQAYLVSLDGDPERTDKEPKYSFQTRNSAKRVPDDPTNFSEYRALNNDMAQLEQSLTEGAKRITDTFRSAFPKAPREESQERMEYLLDHVDTPDKTLAKRFIVTSKREYQSGFGKAAVSGNLMGLTRGEAEALAEARALGIGSQGGNYPVPIVLDPTVVLTNAGALDPMRKVARVIPVAGNTFDAVASLGITASYASEAAAATDNSPTLTQPSFNVEKAHVYVPFSNENAEDWSALSTEIGAMIADSKKVLESTKFISGAGHGSQQPAGLHVGATAIVTASATLVVGDLYALTEALPERWQDNASILANRKYLNKIRAFDTAGGASLWVQLGDGYPLRLLDYPTYVHSGFSSSTATGSTILTIGDFSKYYIVDRIGMDAQFVPVVFGTTGTPTGQSAIYAHWRNTAGVLDYRPFVSLKLP